MKNYKTKLLITALAVAGFTQVASASLVIYDETTLTEEAIAPNVGGTAYLDDNTSFGGYTLVITTGQTDNGGTSPLIDLDVSATSVNPNDVPDTLEIAYTDGTFGPSSSTYTLSTYLGSGTTGTMSTSAYLGASPFATTTALGGSSDVIGAVTANATGNIIANGYYLTLVDTITGKISSADSSLSVAPVPEPSTIAAGALMLLPFGIGAIRSLRKERAV